MSADPTQPDDTPEFRSPKRVLARSFRLSRDRWKQKAAQRRQQIKALQIRVRDLQTSRDLWKDKALHLQAQLEQLTAVTTPQPDEGPSAQTAHDVPADNSSARTDQAAPAEAGQPPAGAAAEPPGVTEGPAPKKAPRARR